jgi:hypothetical protein
VAARIQHYTMLQRNLLYTGIARGKRLVVLIGQKKAVAIAVRKCLGTAEVVKTGGMAGSRVKRPVIGANQLVSKLGKQSDQTRRAPGCRQHREAAGVAEKAGRRRLNRLRRKASPKRGEVVR